MKRTDWIFLISVFVYSILFWQQMPGLNFLIFTGILLAGQVLLDPRILKIRKWLLAGAGAMCAAFCVFYYGNPLSVFATFFSLLLASYFACNQKGSVLTGIFSSLISTAASIGFMLVRFAERRAERAPGPQGSRIGSRILIVGCALLVVLVFFFLYRDSSVLFLKLTEKINFDWISFGWICFTIAGALVVYGFYYHNSIPGIVGWDGRQSLNLNPQKEPGWTDKLMSIDSERFSGILLLSLLNIMLLIVNGLDLAFMFGNDGQLPDGVSRTAYVHQGVGTLIVSIILAMLIILFYFRGRMNFSANGKALRMLAFAWIVQNAFMLFSTAWRNEVYILSLGLTYKRIGVYFYLLLTLIGLIVTAWKVQGKKTNAFLVRMNSWLFYSVWIIACFVNWDGLIISNNLKTNRKPDLAYLNSLSINILPHLIDYSVQHPAETSNAGLTLAIPERAYLFLSDQMQLRTENKWPSYVFKADRNYSELKQRSTFGTAVRLDLSGRELKAIYYFKGFEKITTLEAPYNDLENIGEAAKFPNLRVLALSNNPNLISVSGIENASKLEYLDLSGTHVADLSPLLHMKKLKWLNIDHMADDMKNKLHAVNPQLEIVTRY
ncbi:MAG: DUF4173 domain-containing protein [Bacteroidota bacterium]|nr:DUF4173 domain-containing protein [Bacteroidota bacterium]